MRKNEAPVRPMMKSLYNVGWQRLRVSFLGHWNSEREVEENIQAMRDYIDCSGSDEERWTRLWRVVNLCNAVAMGYNGQRVRDEPYACALRRFRVNVTLERATMAPQDLDYVFDNDETIIREWFETPAAERQLIAESLLNRRKFAGHSPYRPELSWFIQLVMRDLP